MKSTKISLIGLGAMGAFFAPRLSDAFGNNFRIIAGGKRKERLEKNGITVNGVNYKFPVISPDTENDPADLIIIAVKGYSLGDALLDIKNQVGENTIILPVLNGVDSEDETILAYGKEHVLYSYMRISIVMKDGVADFNPNGGLVHFGEKTNDSSHYSDRVNFVKEIFDKAAIPYEIDEDMVRGIWFKYMCNIGENMTCGLLGVPFGAFQSSDHANNIRIAAMQEVLNIAQKKGISLSQKDIDAQNINVKNIPYPNKPSTLQDLEGKKHTEVDMFAGQVIKMGKELNVPTPVCELFYNGIRVLEEKNDGII